MSDSSTTLSGEWWESISAYENNYVPDSFTPSSSVEANHDLLSGLRDNDFDITNQDYTYGLLTLAIVFLVAGVLACCLLPCIYTCLGKSHKERLAERLRIGHSSNTKLRGNLIMVVAVVAAIGTAVGAVWGLATTDNGLTVIENDTQEITDDLRAVLSLPNDTSKALDGLSTSYDSLLENFDACILTVSGVQGTLTYEADLVPSSEVEDFMANVENAVESLDSETLDKLADDVQDVSDAVETTKGIRKGVVWPVLSLSILMIMIFLVISLGVYGIIAFKMHDCTPIANWVSPCSIFLAVIIWLSAASAVTLSALTGDFCIDPDTNVETLLVTDETKDALDETLTGLIVYYTGDCTSDNVAIDVIIDAQTIAISFISSTLPSLYELADACSDISPFVQDVDDSMRELWAVLQNAGELTSCENLNAPYQDAVYNELCTSLPAGLLGFWVSCVILTVLLLLLAVLWSNMLKQIRTDDHAAVIEEEQRRWTSGTWHSGGWGSRLQSGTRDSRGTQNVVTGVPAQRAVEIANPQRAERG